MKNITLISKRSPSSLVFSHSVNVWLAIKLLHWGIYNSPRVAPLSYVRRSKYDYGIKQFKVNWFQLFLLRKISLSTRIRKLLIGGFRKKRNRGNTSTGARPELFDTWSWQPNDRKWFWLDGIESCCVRVEGSSKSICVSSLPADVCGEATVSGVSFLHLSSFFASTQARGKWTLQSEGADWPVSCIYKKTMPKENYAVFEPIAWMPWPVFTLRRFFVQFLL